MSPLILCMRVGHKQLQANDNNTNVSYMICEGAKLWKRTILKRFSTQMRMSQARYVLAALIRTEVLERKWWMCRKTIPHYNDCVSMGNEPCNMWMRKWRHYVELFILMFSFKKPLNTYCGLIILRLLQWHLCLKKGDL